VRLMKQTNGEHFKKQEKGLQKIFIMNKRKYIFHNLPNIR
jgi:hypothetical protein